MTKRITVRVQESNFRAMADERRETGRSFSAQVNAAIFKRRTDRIMAENERVWNERGWKEMIATTEMGPLPEPSPRWRTRAQNIFLGLATLFFVGSFLMAVIVTLRGQ